MTAEIPSCEACRPDAPKLTEEEAERYLSQLSGWQLVTRDAIPMLEKRYGFSDFKQALAFTNSVGGIAEEVGHHPELFTEWGAVTVRWWSHKIKGLHELDFAMAKRCDNV